MNRKIVRQVRTRREREKLIREGVVEKMLKIERVWVGEEEIGKKEKVG
ncbi:hypothetical protein [Priestia megaterium]|nr:hypothetical protein [Priestia megaterium]